MAGGVKAGGRGLHQKRAGQATNKAGGQGQHQPIKNPAN